ncbi:MMS19 nucleotide excision repair protein homolog isoform X1 [Typha latifolia]|uniref:MMS19 nucleotide excision repair protein homolog isoform X1 n=2 Tax=Typha latifolia TaxID=4733 RepID=UPI003C2CDB44
MANPSSWIPHVEAFVDTSRPKNEHAASLEAIAILVKKDMLSLLELVKEMGMYLTTTDHVIRSRGILLLAEVLTGITLKPLDRTTISSLVNFFTSRLSDWQALHGALVGCLALLQRKISTCNISINDARKLAESFLTNVQVQSLAANDRKLSFEILRCLLDYYPEAVVMLGDDLVYGLCEAIDEEKDPQCLMLSFHLVESAMRLLQDQSDSVAHFAGDVFEILSKYFPVYFTHGGGNELGVSRDGISRALMVAFCSTPYFEPFAIPLLLDKLSSSLPLAKLDSLKYLNNCIPSYGADRMAKHSKAIWSNLKDVIFSSAQGCFLSTSELAQDIETEEYQIGKEALNCLQTAILYLTSPDKDLLLNLILDDVDIASKFQVVMSSIDISEERKNHLNALGSIFSVLLKSSTYFCNRVFQKYFPHLMDILGIPASSTSSIVSIDSTTGMNIGALYLCVEILSSCKELTLASQEFSKVSPVQETWWHVLEKFSDPLSHFFRALLDASSKTVNNRIGQEHVLRSVRGLQVLATFPGHYLPISEDVYRDILSIFMSVITCKYEDAYLWKLSLKALVEIGLSVDKFHDFARGIIYSRTVVGSIISLLQLDNPTMPLTLKLDAICEIGAVGLDHMSRVVQALEEAIIFNISRACIDGRMEFVEIVVALLTCYSSQVLPWLYTHGIFNEIATRFAICIWNEMENLRVPNEKLKDQGFLDSLMRTMKLLVAGCTEEHQSLIVKRAYSIVSSSTSLLVESLPCPFSKIERVELPPDFFRNEWFVYLFASVVIALHPQTPLPDVNVLVNLFTGFLLEGHVPPAQALASIVNKWSTNINISECSSVRSLDKAIEFVLERCFSSVLGSSHLRKLNSSDDSEGDTSCLHRLKNHTCSKINVVSGLAWIGKGLLMRGHEKLKEITKFLLKCLISSQNIEVMPSHLKESGNCDELDTCFLLAKAAADAFNVIMSDSEVCLNKKFHATVKPLYKQRFFSSLTPVLLSSIKESITLSTNYRMVLYRAFGHVISDAPLAAVVAEAHKIIPTLIDSLTVLSLDARNKDLMYSLLLVLSGILMDVNGKESIIENIHIIIRLLTQLVSYPHMMLVRETAIQCLIAMSGLPHSRIYPMRPQVLRAVTKALDDKKRAVRREAVRCRQTWASIASRSLHY